MTVSRLARMIFGVVLAVGVCAGFAGAGAEEPRAPFADVTPPPRPNYDDEAAWAALPWRRDAADVVPSGARPGDRQSAARVDVFFMHPTTDLRHDRWNAPVEDAATNAWTDRSVIARQASIFNAAGRVFAPRYRQGSSGSGRPDVADGGPTFALAYDDARHAFQYYLTHWNQGRPFILAGHSQGSFMVIRLLEDVAADPGLRARLVAAYVVGGGLTRGNASARFPEIPPCAAPTQVGCIAAWNSYLEGGDAEGYARSARRFALEAYGSTSDTELLCTNPVTFDADRAAARASANLGALPGEPGKSGIGALVPHATGARCDGGVLIVDRGTTAKLHIAALPGGSMHFHDYGMFYENIRRNAVDRARVWLARHAQPRARPPPSASQ